MMQEGAGSLVPSVGAELLKVSWMLVFGGRPLNRNARRRIGPTQRRILVFLLSQSHHPVTLTRLAKGVALSLPTVSDVVKGLAARGCVRKARSKDDARVVFLSLSVAGRREAEQAVAGSHHLSAAIARLTSEEQTQVLHVLKHIQQAMAAG